MQMNVWQCVDQAVEVGGAKSRTLPPAKIDVADVLGPGKCCQCLRVVPLE
jgi:hypothetical protein